ncbi:hypothetical protein GIB67_020522 [Kingdonia uniflora]|uniref:Inositol oxygenase n=1 Tax=Kingdonia uniflora TaxID=39325 RepID=A0A7J7NLX2_9MAGN|nr:hypothetical protein GIB67_020522 [Kingdonia uniflora]
MNSEENEIKKKKNCSAEGIAANKLASCPYLEENPDYNNPAFNTKYGIYSERCGDDYMYLAAKENKTTLPFAGLFIVRYLSFYPLHKSGAFKYLMNDEDDKNLKWLHIFK